MSWNVVLGDHPLHVLDEMRKAGLGKLHNEVVLFLRSLALEAGSALRKERALPGLPMGDGMRYNVDIQGLPVLVTYLCVPGADVGSGELRVTELIWIRTD